MMLAFCGFQGSGKTYYGKIIAEKLNLAFYDVDDHLGKDPRHLHILLGEEGFREKEKEVIQRLLENEKGVLALGGGSFTRDDVAGHIFKRCFVVFLELSYERLVENLHKNMLNGDLPSYLDPKDPLGSFDAIYKKRYEQYVRFSHEIISLDEHVEERLIKIYGK